MPVYRKLVALLLVFVSTTAGYCGFTPWWSNTPPEGPGGLSVPYTSQINDWYCVPAVVAMWHDRMAGHQYSVDQFTLWSWVRNALGTNHVKDGLGMSSLAVEYLAEQWLPGTVYSQYVSREQATADIQKGLQNGNPTIALLGSGLYRHAVLVVGASWHRLADAMQRPSVDYMKVHDPWPGWRYNNITGTNGGANVVLSVGFFMNLLPNVNIGGRSEVVQMSGQYYSAQLNLQGFNLDGGVYAGPGPDVPTGRHRRDGNGYCYWDANDSGDDQCVAQASIPHYLDERLYPETHWTSGDGRFRLRYQGDGNLVLYRWDWQPLWASGAWGTAGNTRMQADGNLVIYNAQNAPVWWTGTHGNAGAQLIVQNDGNVVLYSTSGVPLWATGTDWY